MKLPSNQTHIRVPISAIRDTGNVRLEYDEEGIRELAASIRRDGLINAVTVKPPVEDENGIKTYELIAGHRRIRALKYLCEQGDDFSMVECKILTGEMWALQMIENIQRTDLSSRDKEEAISYALSIGLSQTQIAEKLSKPIQYISDIVAGAKIRKIADEHGLDTKDIATKTLSQLRSIPEEEVPVFVEQLIREGGTYRVATRMMNAQKQWEDAHSQSNPTTYVSSENSEQDDIDEQINGMFMDEADDVEYDEDESMIEPAEMTEAEFNYRDERNKIESRFVMGTEIDKVGKRLFFKDLWNQRYIAMKINKKNIVCTVSSDIKPSSGQVMISYFKSNGEAINIPFSKRLVDDTTVENGHWFFYEIPDDAKKLAVPIFTNFDDKEKAPYKKPEPFTWNVTNADNMMSVFLELPSKMKRLPAGTKLCVKNYGKVTAISAVQYFPAEDKLIFHSAEPDAIHY